MNNIFRYYKCNNVFDKDLVIIGNYPPPLGGIAVHIQRLLPLLNKNNISYSLFNQGHYAEKNIYPTNKRYMWWIVFFLFSLKNRKRIKNFNPLFHYHVFTWYHYPYLFLFSRLVSDRIFITIHTDNLFYYNSIKRYITLRFLKGIRSKTLIVVSSNLGQYLKKRNIQSTFIPAFLPPYKVNKKSINEGGGNKDIIKIATNMWRFNRRYVKIYGVDLLVRIVQELDGKIALYIFVSDDRDKDGEKDLLLEMDPSMDTDIHVIYNKSLIEYMHNFGLFVRPNREDGYGMAIVEALLANVPAIASDTCVRPEDAIIFKNGDYSDLKNKIESFIRDGHVLPTGLNKKYNWGKQLIRLYKREL